MRKELPFVSFGGNLPGKWHKWETTIFSNGGIEITGSAKITVNGSAVSISPSDVVIDITAGSEPLSGFVRMDPNKDGSS